MNVTAAINRIGVKADDLNAREASIGFPALHEADISWPAIGRELQLRLSNVALQTCNTGRPSMPALEALGAWVVIAMLALDAAETVDVTTGSEEIAA